MATVAARPAAEHRRCGRHVFVVCTGEECCRKGALELLRELRSACEDSAAHIRIAPARCLGHCGLAPAMMENGEIVGAMSGRRLRIELARLGLQAH
jgi:bidirectional [NiFe] hydrogenase diaphorase subunit